MNERNTNRLLEDFPHLYRRYNDPPERSSMCFGFECGDGWFDLIYDLSRNIDSRLKLEPKEMAENFAVVQVKEKFGCLRYYTSGSSETISRMIRKAEMESTHICERCSRKGGQRIIEGVWITLCKRCLEKSLRKMAPLFTPVHSRNNAFPKTSR